MGCLDANPTTGWNWEGGKDGHAPACAKKSAIEEERDGAGPAIWGDAAPLKGTAADVAESARERAVEHQHPHQKR